MKPPRPRTVVPALVTLAACGTADNPTLDGGPPRDGRAGDARVADAPPSDAPSDAAPGAYRRTIVIDGVDDFTADERFETTSAPSFVARVTWDDSNVFVGYGGPDLTPSATDAGTKWLLVYLDRDPGAGTGAAAAELYNTQQATFPTGFGAEYYARYKVDGTLASIQQRDAGGAWSTASTALTAAQAGTFVELAIPRSLLAGSSAIGLTAYMINERDLAEGTYAGLLAGAFTDGYNTAAPITRYLRIDVAAARTPADPANVVVP